MPKSALLALVVSVAVACSADGSSEAPSSGPGADTPEEAVAELIALLSDGEFGSASALAVPNQAALGSLAEGATIEEVAEAIRGGDGSIATNFWTGFAQSVEAWLAEGIEVVGSETVEESGVEFSVVTVKPPSGPERTFVTRDVDGHRVDLFATFGPALASRLYPQVERLFTSPVEDSSFVLSELREQVPSLYMAASTPDLASNVVQDVLQLIELVTRVN